VWDPVLKRQIERHVEGLEAAKRLLVEFHEAKRRHGRLGPEQARFTDVAARYLLAYRLKRDGSPRPKSSLAKERTCLNVYILPAFGNAWIGDLDLPELNSLVRNLTLQDGRPASGSTKSTVASVLRRLFAWAVCASEKSPGVLDQLPQPGSVIIPVQDGGARLPVGGLAGGGGRPGVWSGARRW
jgi:hypothetical protein